VCGTLYNLIFKAPKVPGVCDLDGGKLIVREDDRESVIRERLEEYQQQTRPILDYFRAKGKRIHDVDASHDQPEVVFRKIETLIQEQ
jgi:adenylate kinase